MNVSWSAVTKREDGKVIDKQVEYTLQLDAPGSSHTVSFSKENPRLDWNTYASGKSSQVLKFCIGLLCKCVGVPS